MTSVAQSLPSAPESAAWLVLAAVFKCYRPFLHGVARCCYPLKNRDETDTGRRCKTPWKRAFSAKGVYKCVYRLAAVLDLFCVFSDQDIHFVYVLSVYAETSDTQRPEMRGHVSEDTLFLQKCS